MTKLSLNRLIEVRDALGKAKDLLREADTDTWIEIVRAYSYINANVEVAAKEVSLEVTQ